MIICTTSLVIINLIFYLSEFSISSSSIFFMAMFSISPPRVSYLSSTYIYIINFPLHVKYTLHVLFYMKCKSVNQIKWRA